MSVTFVFALVAYLAISYAPGYLALRGLGADRPWALCLAPLISTSLCCITAELAAAAGLRLGAVVILCVVALLCAGAFALGRKMDWRLELPRLPWTTILVYVVLGCMLCSHLFLRRLTYPDELVQAYDLTHHVNLIRAFADASHFSSLDTGYYLSEADLAIRPIAEGSFYPAGWHTLCAFVVQLTGLQVPMAINASLFASMAFILPLSTAAAFALLFEGHDRLVRVGAVICLSFVMFPWTLYFFGPLYPNLAGLSLVPGELAMLALAVRPWATRAERLRAVAIPVVGIIGLAMVHPGCIFTLGLIAAPMLCNRLWEFVYHKTDGSIVKASLAAVGFTAICCTVWFLLYKAPALQPTVTHEWPKFANTIQEIINIATLSFDYGLNVEYDAQILLSLLIAIGAVRAVHNPKWVWMAGAYVLACITCYAGAVLEGEIKHLLAGFWYTDVFRLGSTACLAGTPLASLGLDWVCDVIVDVANSYNTKRGKTTHVVKIGTAVCGIFLLINIFPNFSVPGDHYALVYNTSNLRKVDWDNWDSFSEAEQRLAMRPLNSHHTAFGDFRETVEEILASDLVLEEREQNFIRQAMEIIPEGSVVINNPLDGSFLAYGFFDLRVYYRSFLGCVDPGESADSEIIRRDLARISTKEEVRQAVDNIGADYVLLISHKNADISYVNLRGDYKKWIYRGIGSINDATPGFEIVLSEDDMRLFRIIKE